MTEKQENNNSFADLKASLDSYRNETRIAYGELRNILDPEILREEIFSNPEVFEALAKREEQLFNEETEFVFGYSNMAKGQSGVVANIGSGWGVFSRAAVLRNQNLTVMDVDFNPVVCLHDQAYNHAHTTSNIPFDRIQNFVMDAGALGIAPGSIDEVISFGVMRYIPQDKQEQVVSEALRTAKPGARIIIGDVNTQAVNSFEQILSKNGIKASREQQEIEVLRATTFYFYYLLYAGKLPKNDNSLPLSLDNIKEQVDIIAKTEGISAIGVLLDLAGKDKRLAEVLVFDKV
ncbi:MAG: class I SAM-dependent methyltransferase [candidate division WWE3 bacterium]|nr:class I SAM-dependent methyltransferase [candidate division WWE3 bacterium]